jgi:hypothetical protein
LGFSLLLFSLSLCSLSARKIKIWQYLIIDLNAWSQDFRRIPPVYLCQCNGIKSISNIIIILYLWHAPHERFNSLKPILGCPCATSQMVNILLWVMDPSGINDKNTAELEWLAIFVIKPSLVEYLLY